MKLALTKKEIKGGSLYQTTILGQTLTLSKRLVEKLRADGELKKEIECKPEYIMTVTQKEVNGKTFNNFYLTIPKPKTEDDVPTDGDLPF